MQKISDYTVQAANQYIQEHALSSSELPYHPSFHITAPVGWINDPNGLVYFRGEYHAFFQFYPYESEWGPMHWGHVKSKDLVHWEHLPTALAPEYEYEKGGCFSGSAVVQDDKLYLIYTGHNAERSPKEVQCVAVSEDGVTFEKLASNPVVVAPPAKGSEDFRDPKVTLIDGTWHMIVGTCKDGIGKAVYYTSDNLEDWTYGGVLLESNGSQGTMWECPDFFSLDGYDILIYSPMELENSKTRYILGQWDKENNRFETIHEDEIDVGPDFYAPQTFEDGQGRRLLIGWMNMWEKAFIEKEEGWAGALTMPRELRIVDEKLHMQVPKEWKNLQKKEIFQFEKKTLKEETEVSFDFTTIVLETTLDRETAFQLDISSSPEDTLSLAYQDGELTVDRSGMKKGDKDVTRLAVPDSETVQIDAYIDHSSLELFINGGEKAATFRVYFEKQGVTLKSRKAANFHSFSIQKLEK
ncbi:glycoside hydrolase family 32 protein [Alteribacillus bidgolensis]|uniref:Sucrose-6-phosphate hydrolase n=1 Tax=Alteribacillus bidgolensis TaxID=930129 RepID=A0A1G8GXD3_9BACI|nr:glycoside hydrolase family 32 protein [Alteribacillus bidgolensis]SDH99017.1 beta-fructofuranosidase [Alteribacillus bidgolensis]